MNATAFLATFLLSSVAAGSQEPPRPAGARVVTATRQVALFSELEGRVLGAIQGRSRPALEGLLTEDFEVWSPEPPGAPLPRKDWLEAALSGPALQSFDLRQMAVRSFGAETAVASFVLSLDPAPPGKGGSSFVVDVWVLREGAWRLSARYLSHAEGGPPGPRKPTGKE